jgi:hypothetical protein
LTCARALQAKGVDCLVVEAADAPGGRVRTDEVEGFKLDRGFQVLLTAYPAARAWLDYEALRLGAFEPGARVATPDGEGRVSDPWRRPGTAWETLRAPVGTLGDKLRVGALRLASTRGGDEAMWAEGAEAADGGVGKKRIRGGRGGRTTAEELARRGFSPTMTERFLRPWLGGIFLERELTTPAEMMFFVYRMFARGVAALPAGGMQRIPEQLAAGLRPGSLRLGARVAAVRAGEVELITGETLAAREVVVATEAGAGLVVHPEPVVWRGVSCVQWAAEASPLGGEPMLWLNGTGRGRVNNLVVPSDVAAGYAPEGKTLISTTVVDPSAAGMGDAVLVAALGEELVGHFGAAARGWRVLAVQRIPRALPVLAKPGAGGRVRRGAGGAWICGDHAASASIQGAMASGQAVAEALLRRA